MKKILSVFLLLLSSVINATPSHATEKIISFDSFLAVNQNGEMTVTETIVVNSEGRNIRRGIYRDFPTTYKDHLGNRYRVGFEIISVKRNNRREDYHTKNQSNGVRAYFGNKNRMLKPGIHEYEFTYRTSRQLGFFEQHDELYWNVTGNGWNFSIDKATATVRLPRTVPRQAIRIEGYTGSFGSKDQHYQTSFSDNGFAQIETTRALGPNQGLTLVVSWPKGHVHEPTRKERLGHLVDDNKHLLFLSGGLLILLVYYLIAWSRVGRDQEKGVIIPLYYPPKGYSPASMRFIKRRSYDHKTFATALVNLAVKSVITLDEHEDKSFTVRRTNDTKDVKLAAGEKVLLEKLLGSKKFIELEQENHAKISEAIKAHKSSLKRDYEKIYFVRNSGWIVPGILITIATVVLSVLTGKVEAAPPVFFLIIWLSIWSSVVYYLFLNAFRTWRSKSYGLAVKATVFAGVFGIFELFAIFAFTQVGSISLLVGILLAIGINLVFYQLLHADTRAGRRLMDKAEGFRQYLDIAEGEELRMSGGPSMTTDLFEMYLPYALALDVEQRWAERFTTVFAKLEREGTPYSPHWYHGSHWHHHNVAGFTNAIGGSLSSTISSSSTAPGSSSGGGGGGFSGGGGGGGGGGGW